MGLANTLSEENINNINSYKESYINEISNLTEYRDCKEFVSFVNNKKLFAFWLLLLEINLINTTQFESFYSINKKLINMVKEYPDKNLKRKYLRLDNDEIEIFNYTNFRVQQINNNEFFNIKELLENSTDDDKDVSFDTIPVQDLIYIMLGGIYLFYAEKNADFLIPITKKIIKKSFSIAKRYSITEVTPSDFQIINDKVHIKYKRALDVLSK